MNDQTSSDGLPAPGRPAGATPGRPAFATEADREEWEGFVRSGGGTLFHRWEWLDLFRETPLENRSLLIRDAGQIVAVLPLLAARTFGVSFAYSMPLGVGGPLGQDPVDFLNLALPLLRRSVDCLQITTLTPLGPGFPQSEVPTVAIDLSPSDDVIFGKLEKTVRYEIRKAESAGLEVQAATSSADWQQVAELYARTMHRKGSGGSIWPSVLTGLARLEPTARQALIARREGIPISANVCIRHGANAFYFAEGSDERFRKLMANRLLLWRNILWARAQGSQVMQLGGGGSGNGDDSLYRYKLKYGEASVWHRTLIATSARGFLAKQAYHLLSDDLKRRLRAWRLSGREP